MSKGIYRSVDVERVSVSVFVAALTAATVIVGIDIAKLDLFAAFAVETGSIVQIVRFRCCQQWKSA